MKSTKSHPLVAAAVSAALAAGSLSALAAENAYDELEEVVVTAQFVEQNLQETPVAITAITAEMLEARSQTRIADVTAQSPNVLLQVNPAGGGNSMRAFIRGVGQGDQSPSVDPGVGIYVDDVYFATITASVFELLDLERVEILRGPQGTLSGMNSQGGAVKMYSRKPTGEGGYVEGIIGNLDRRELRASGDFTLAPGKLFARVTGMSRSREGYVKRLDYACMHPDDPYVISGAIPRGNHTTDCSMGTLGGQSVTALRGSLRWVASDDVEVNLIGDVTSDKSESQPMTLLRAAEFVPGASLSYQGVPYDNRYVAWGPEAGDTVVRDPYVNYADFLIPGVTYTPLDVAGTPGPNNGVFYAEPVNQANSWGASAAIDWRLPNGLMLKSITGYRDYTTVSGHDNDGSPAALLASLSEFYHDQFSQELRLSGRALDGMLDFTVGGMYFRQKTTYETRESDPFLVFFGPDPMNFPIFDFIQTDTTKNTFKGAFLHTLWHFTDQFSASAGIRYTDQDKDYTYYRFNVDGVNPFQPLSDPANPLNGRTGNFSGSHTDYRVSLDYKWTDDVMTYLSFATGFKGGGVTPRPYVPEQVRGFGPEELEAWEFGLKSRLFDRRLQANLALFYNDYIGYQGMASNCVDENGQLLPEGPQRSPCGQYLNVADAKVKGAELELEIRPVRGMLIDAAYSYLDFKFGAPYVETGSVIEGQRAPGIGRTKWSTGVQYTWNLPSGATFTPRLDVFYTPGYCGNLACDPVVSNSPYKMANARLTYRTADESWNVALEVTNLDDKLYYINKFYAGTYVTAMPGAPRSWALSVRRRF